MLKLVLAGCSGYMGRVVTDIVSRGSDISIVAGIDLCGHLKVSYPVFNDPADFTGDADVVLDFSNPTALDGLLFYCKSKSTPLILCATGYSPEQIDTIEQASKQIPIFRSGNMSVGINLLADLIKRACAVLGEDFDVEIIERHHRRKVDAPSGTAIMLADAASSALPYDADYVYERESIRKPRDKHEIGISAMRGGTIVGVHDVIFAGLDEVIEFRHTAASRDVFAVGALRAVRFITGKPAGLYNMKDVLV
jgi:4-hydroxy-tetrahydrodipicolinate reductase